MNLPVGSLEVTLTVPLCKTSLLCMVLLTEGTNLFLKLIFFYELENLLTPYFNSYKCIFTCKDNNKLFAFPPCYLSHGRRGVHRGGG